MLPEVPQGVPEPAELVVSGVGDRHAQIAPRKQFRLPGKALDAACQLPSEQHRQRDRDEQCPDRVPDEPRESPRRPSATATARGSDATTRPTGTVPERRATQPAAATYR